MRIESAAALLIVFVLAGGTLSASQETYLQDVASEIQKSTAFLDEASDAISDCGLSLECFQDPEPHASRIDRAVVGLQGIHANLTRLDVPAQYNASHTKLLLGYQQTIDGLILFAAGIRENDLDKVQTGADLLVDGRENRTEGASEILSQARAPFDLSLVLIIAIIGVAATLVVLMFLLGRQASQDRLERIHSDAKCPKCGQVLDQWWTYRPWQIRQWRVDHLRSHERDVPPGKGSEGRGV